MKSLTALFGFGVFGVVFSLGMTIYSGVQEARQKVVPPSEMIPVPAMGQ